jgi:VanZ family protein
VIQKTNESTYVEIIFMLPQKISRVVAWGTLAVILILSLVPPGARPITPFPHKIEHAGIFLLNGAAFGIAYCGYEWLSSFGAVVFCASIEVAQLMIPGRHARFSDFLVDAFAICVGILAGSSLIRITRRCI